MHALSQLNPPEREHCASGRRAVWLLVGALLAPAPLLAGPLLTEPFAATGCTEPPWNGQDSFGMRLAAMALQTTVATAGPGQTRLVSRSSQATAANQSSHAPSISGDGRFIAFTSLATNLVSGDRNGVFDVFLRDLATGHTRRVSVASDGTEGDGMTQAPSLSQDGRRVAFASYASNFAPVGEGRHSRVFMHEVASAHTWQVSVASDGSDADWGAYSPSISADGRWVAFQSRASNLVPDDTNYRYDAFVHDVETGITTRVSVGTGGHQADGHSFIPEISGDGRIVVFESLSGNLVPGEAPETRPAHHRRSLFMHDRDTQETTRVAVLFSGHVEAEHDEFGHAVNADGSVIAYTRQHRVQDWSGTWQTRNWVHVYDRVADTHEIVSIASNGELADSESWGPSIDAEGRYVSFTSLARNLDPDTQPRQQGQVFVHDRVTGTTRAAVLGHGGVSPNAGTSGGVLSADGSVIALHSTATNLLPPGACRFASNRWRVFSAGR